MKFSIWLEKHENDQQHYHFPILADRPVSSRALDLSLRKKKIYASFTANHDNYFSIVLYLAVPSARKVTVDSHPWLCPGHESIRDILEHPPRSARKCDKDRAMAFLGCPTGSIMFSHHAFTKWLQDYEVARRCWQQRRTMSRPYSTCASISQICSGESSLLLRSWRPKVS